MLFAALRVSYQTESMRPLGATEIVPNQCHLFWGLGSSLIRIGALKVWPPSVLRENMTLVPLPAPVRNTLANMYTLLLVAVPERSTARNVWPQSPIPFMPP